MGEVNSDSSAPVVAPPAINGRRPNLNPLRRLRIQLQQQSVDSDSRSLFRPNRFRRNKIHRSEIPNTISYDPQRRYSIATVDHEDENSTIDDESLVQFSLDATAIQKPKLPTAATKIAIIHADSLPSAIALWFKCVQSLWHTQELQMLLQASMLVLDQSKQTAWNVMVMPIVVPTNLCLQVTQTVVESTTQVFAEHQQHHENPLHPLTMASMVFEITTKLVFQMVGPVCLLGATENPEIEPQEKAYKAVDCPAKKFDEPFPDYLDRLRLDFGLPSENSSALGLPKCYTEKDSAKLEENAIVHDTVPKGISKYLLRVDDLDIQEPTSQVAYIDLDSTADTSLVLIQDALKRLVTIGLGMASTNTDIPLFYESTVSMHWHPEGATKRLLRKIVSESDVLLRETLVWSGRAESCKQHPFFLARGSIPMSPRALLHLMWDNTRTSEYNNYCMGRTTLLSIGGESDADAAILMNGAQSATKIIKSEMKVPFAGITVRAICLMHVTPLPDCSGYAILSRTLDAGDAGNHMVPCGTSICRGSNEILWGCNIIRPAESSSLHTDLISMSQVGSNVPSFLSQKIGLMGISDFFRNVRSLC